MIYDDMIYSLTAIGLTPGGSSTAHIYTQTIHRTIHEVERLAPLFRKRNSWVPISPRRISVSASLHSSSYTSRTSEQSKTVYRIPSYKLFIHHSNVRCHRVWKHETVFEGTITTWVNKRICFKFVFPCIIVQVKWNTNLMQHCAGFISAGSLYMFRAQAPIIRSI